ncbi:hypothetical protein ALC53_06396 [Atta colombica]|uniref:Uncharacterized protein n=1 Tax=Atta colombica TaxID=520822 RepID=A0A195BFZ7_9HYME|nr:hypothetical protein ALC53_06396 [Atta colombica]
MEKWTADDEPVVKLSSYLHLHELRSTLFGFVKIADGGEARETGRCHFCTVQYKTPNRKVRPKISRRVQRHLHLRPPQRDQVGYWLRGEKGADSRHRNGLLIALLEKSMHKSNLARATTPDYGFGRIDNQWIRRISSPVSQKRPPSADEFRDTGIGFRGRAGATVVHRGIAFNRGLGDSIPTRTVSPRRDSIKYCPVSPTRKTLTYTFTGATMRRT